MLSVSVQALQQGLCRAAQCQTFNFEARCQWNRCSGRAHHHQSNYSGFGEVVRAARVTEDFIVLASATKREGERHQAFTLLNVA